MEFWYKVKLRSKELKMLVLSRKKNEAVVIGDNIEIIVVDVRGGRARFGISAPANIPVHRKEIYEKIQSSKGDKSS